MRNGKNSEKPVRADNSIISLAIATELADEVVWQAALARLIRWQSSQYMGKDNQPRLSSVIAAAEQTITGRLA